MELEYCVNFLEPGFFAFDMVMTYFMAEVSKRSNALLQELVAIAYVSAILQAAEKCTACFMAFLNCCTA